MAYAFKLDEGRYGQLTFLRVYQGTLRKGDTVHQTRTRKKIKIGRLVRMHADKMEDIEVASAGDIVGIFGIDCHTGDTFTGAGPRINMTSMYVPEPVISLSVHPVDSKAQDNMSKALSRFTKEDPTFRVNLDPESNETIISGMGELHLEVYVERMKREYSAEVETGAPQVAYREAISRRADFDYLHKKQTGGSGQYAKVVGYIEPSDRRRLRVRRRDPRRPHSDRVHPRLRQGLPVLSRQGQADRLPGGGRARGPHRRQLARGRLLGHGVHDRLEDGLPRGLQKGRDRRSSSP